MHNNVSDRLKILLGKLNLNIKEFALECDVPYRTMQDYIAGKITPGGDNLVKITTVFRVSIDWLLTGEGSMEREPGGGYLYNNVSDVTKLIVQVLQEMPEEAQRDILKHVEEKKLLRELMKERKERKEGA